MIAKPQRQNLIGNHLCRFFLVALFVTMLMTDANSDEPVVAIDVADAIVRERCHLLVVPAGRGTRNGCAFKRDARHRALGVSVRWQESRAGRTPRRS